MLRTGMRASRLATLLGALLTIVIGIAAVVSMLILRQQAIEDWRREASAIALMLAENVGQQMSSAYLALDTVTEKIRQISGDDGHKLQTLRASQQVHQLLAERVSISPQIDSISILSDKGDLINFSRHYPAPPLNLSERDYFKAHVANPGLGVFISEPIRNKFNHKWTFYISRRINDREGQLIGLVVLGISTDHYSDYFERVSLEGRATISLLRDDFMILTRWPRRDDMLGKLALTGPPHIVVKEMKRKHGVVTTDNARLSEGGKSSTRMGAVRTVEHYPLIVNFAIEEEMYLGEWRKAAAVIGAVTIGSMLAVVFSFGLLVRAFRRRETDLEITNQLKRQADDANQAKTFLLANMAEQQHALMDASERMEAIFQHAADGIVIIDEDGRIESFNHAAEQIYGYPASEVIGRPGSMLVPPGVSDLVHVAATAPEFASTGKLHIEADRLRKDGTLFPAELSMGKFYMSGHRKLILIIRDISERRRMERTKSEFVSTVSHELRTPLTSIRGALGLLDHGVLGELPARARPLVSVAHQNSERLTRLINDLLDVQKMEAGKMDFNFSMQPLTELLHTACEANRPFGQRLGVSICLEKPVPEVALHVDPDRFQQVIANLLSNACKYSPRGETVILRALLVSEHVLRLEVSDCGPGIAEQFRARIFQKFSQADSSDTRAKDGTGLGLAIAQAIVLEMNGVLDYHSEPGQGATFYMDLPAFDLPAESLRRAVG